MPSRPDTADHSRTGRISTPLWSADTSLAFEYAGFRVLARSAGIGAIEGLSVALLVYCLLFQRKILRRAG